jgi:hypothetical protein
MSSPYCCLSGLVRMRRADRVFLQTGDTVAGVEKVARQSQLSSMTKHAFGAVVNGSFEQEGGCLLVCQHLCQLMQCWWGVF